MGGIGAVGLESLCVPQWCLGLGARVVADMGLDVWWSGEDVVWERRSGCYCGGRMKWQVG